MPSFTTSKAVIGNILTLPLLSWGVRYVAGPLLRLLPANKRPLLPVKGQVTIPFEFRGEKREVRWYSTGRDGIMSRLYWRGVESLEGDTLRFFFELAARSKVFLDVGANTGLFTLLGKKVNPDLRVIAIEPVPFILDSLSKNITINQFSDVSVLGTALSEETCLIDFYINATPFSLPTSASIKKGFAGSVSQTMHVHALTLDELNDSLLGGDCDLAKIDVEGAEFSVLEGSKETLKRGKMLAICEILELEALHRMLQFLAPFDYQVCRLQDGMLAPLSGELPSNLSVENNYFLVPPAWIETLTQAGLFRGQLVGSA